MQNARLYMTLFLLTAATLLLELSMTRLFSVLMFYHFAFMAISIALFGLGASGLFLFLREKRYRADNLERKVTAAILLFALAIVLSLAVSLQLQITTDYSAGNVYRLLIVYVVSLIPFFFSGLAVSVILFVRARDVSRLYFYDLSGAAVGALLTVPVLNLLGAINTQLLAGTLAAAAAVVISGKLRSSLKWIAMAALAVAVGLLIANPQLEILKLRFMKGAVKQNVDYQKWNSFSFITVQSVPQEPNAMAIDIDADARTYILRDPFQQIGTDQIKNQVSRGWVSHIANVLVDSADALIIGPGGGMDVVFALAWGAKSIDAVEINPIIIDDIMLGRYRAFSGDLYLRPEVKVHKGEGRSFVARARGKYDLIQLTLVDTWAASSAGAFSLSENNLYTVEAFVDYLSHLQDDGILSLTRWITAKPKESLRLMTIALDAAKRLNISSPERNIAIVAGRLTGSDQEMATFLFKRSPLTTDDMAKISERTTFVGGRVVYAPDLAEANPFTRLVRATDRQKFIADYEFDIRPTTDNQPFFFNTIRGVDLGKIMKLEPESRKNNLGVFNLYIVGLISIFLVALFLVGPLLLMKTGRRVLHQFGAVKTLSYFVFIGLGFILIEIALMQKFILYLGHPVYSLAVVLTCILISAGLGSLYTDRFNYRTGRRVGIPLFAAIVGLTCLMIWLLPLIIQATFALPLVVRILLSALMLGPLGFCLGQAFPLELKYVDWKYHEIIPWVWSLNGAASVLGSVGAVALAMFYGFNTVLAIAIACYLLAFAARGRC
jgi:hypothetical protein